MKHRSGGRRSQTAFIWLLHLPGTAQEGRGQIDLAPPPHLRCPLLHGAPEVEQTCFLVGNNQLSSPTPYSLYYYLQELVMIYTGTSMTNYDFLVFQHTILVLYHMDFSDHIHHASYHTYPQYPTPFQIPKTPRILNAKQLHVNWMGESIL